MGQMKSLIEAVDGLDMLDEDSTIYASAPWTENSEVIVAPEPQSGGLSKRAEDLGFSYFLEVSVAREFLKGWISNLGRIPNATEKAARLI